MSKKQTIVLLAAAILFVSSIFILAFADDAVIHEKTYAENMTINGISLKDHIVKNKVVVYDGHTYLPMDEAMSKILGVQCSMDDENSIFTIEKNVISDAGLQKAELEPGKEEIEIKIDEVTLVPEFDTEVLVVNSDGGEGQPGRVTMFLDLAGKPVLKKEDVVYVPVSAIVSSGLFGWSVGYDSELGYFISSEKDKAAEQYVEAAKLEAAKKEELKKQLEEQKKAEQEQNAEQEQKEAEKLAAVQAYSGAIEPEKLAMYIQSVNPNVTPEDAQTMAVDAIYYGSTYEVDPLLIMSVMKCESTYYHTITNAVGTCIGLMQVNYNTAAPYGISRDQLFEIDYNICCGAQVLHDYLALFNNDLLLGLTAYNCGPGAARSGRIADTYYNKVVNTYNGIIEYIK